MSKAAKDHATEQDFGPLWQLKQNLETKRQHIREANDTIQRSMKNISRLTAEADEFEKAIALLERR